MAGLNAPQQEAVNTLRGPMLVLAGAGSGKTRVVTFRIANLIKHGVVGDRILAVTFTNKAAAEMQERISGLIGKNTKIRPQISTFHSHCVRVLRRHIRQLGYPEKFAIYDRGDQESLARQVLREIRVPGELMRPGDLLFQIGNWKTHSIRPSEAAQVAKTDKEHLAAMAYRRYQKALKLAGSVDFDDLLLLTEELFTNFADVRKQEASLFDHLLVDEYQDTNGGQYRIIRALAQDHRNLCVVGDDDQSIYGWRGAEVQHILRFSKDWPDAKVVRLEFNYRSTAAILESANKLISFNKLRHDKILRAARMGGEKPRILQFNTETDEARETVLDIQRRMQTDKLEPRDFAILFRTNEQPRAFETELRKMKMPYVLLGSQSFFDRKEVKDLLSYMRVITSPQDEVSMLRVINNPPRGIGDKSVEALMKDAVTNGKPIWQSMTDPNANLVIPAAAKESIHKFTNMLRGFRKESESGVSLAEIMRKLIGAIGYESELKRIYPDPEELASRTAAVEEVVNAVAAYEKENKGATIGGFLDEVTLGEREFGDEKDKALAKNAIVLMTLHSAKGLEFPHVYMVGMEEAILPHHRTLKVGGGDEVDEERRLCYVGITRAQERLTMSLALTRLKWGKPRDTIPSRFLFEMIGQAENAAAMAQKSMQSATGEGARRGAKKSAPRKKT